MTSTRRKALLALLLVAPIPTVGVTIAMFVAPGPVGKALWVAGKVLFYLLPLLWLLLVDRGRVSFSPVRKGGLRVGAALGFQIFLIIVGLYLFLPDGTLDGEGLRKVAATNGFDTIPTFLGISAWVIFVNSLLEEYAYRWFLFTRCRELMSPIAAVLLTALIFVAHHTLLLIGFGIPAVLVVVASVGIFIGGVVWSWCYHRYESIWPGFVSHAIVDVAVLAVGWMLLFG